MLIPLPDVLRGFVHFENKALVFNDGIQPTDEQITECNSYNKALQTETIIFED